MTIRLSQFPLSFSSFIKNKKIVSVSVSVSVSVRSKSISISISIAINYGINN